MLYPDMRPMDPIPSGGGAPKPKPSSYLPTYITVYINKPDPSSAEPPIPNDIVAVLSPASSDQPAYVDRQARPDAHRDSDRATEEQAQSMPEYLPDLEAASETAGVNLGNVTSHEDLFLSMDAVDLSYYFSMQEYELVREVATCLRHEKLIHFFLDDPRACLKLFPTYTWDDEADGAAEEFIQWYVDRFRTELEEQRDIARSGPAFGAAKDTIERWRKDLTNDAREVVIAIDLRTGETLFVRYGDEHSVSLQDKQKELVEDRYIALLHHHPNRGAASLADLDAADWLKAEFLLVSNQDGTLHRYARVGETMIPLEPTRNPEYAAPVNPLETAAADAAYLAQTLLEIGNPPEMVMRQEQVAAEIEISGQFRAYGNQWYADERRGEIETYMNYDFTENPQSFRVLGRSTLNPSLVQIEVSYPSLYQVHHQWVNIEDLEGNFRISGSDLESVPFKYPLRSFVVDETLDIELIAEDPTWPNKSGVGVRSRDFNPVDSTETFLLQSPTIGPDVRVEFVATDHKDLGNFVVISFPASVLKENDIVMQELAFDENHRPDKWLDDGRVFIAFAHLSDWEESGLQRPQPNTIINTPEKGIIGMTGRTGTKVNHLDLSVMYYGSAEDGTQQMRTGLAAVRSNQTSVDYYFGLAGRSNLVGRTELYAENLDPVRIWPELDVLRRAEYGRGESIYN